MKRRRTKFYLLAAGVLLALICLAWYASENFSGRISASVEHLGYAIIWPGHMVDAILSGNLHGGFGGWWSGGIRVAVSWSVWSSPLLLLWLLSGRAGSKEGVQDAAAELHAPPNGGPVAPVSNPSALDRPPSVS